MKNGTTNIQLYSCIFFVTFFAVNILYLPPEQANANPGANPSRTPRKAKFAEFTHSEKAHKQECGTCHKFPSDNWNKVRTGAAAIPDVTEYPKHQSCVTCHKQQFFKGARPAICSTCHTNPSPRDGSRHPFPNPREIFDQSPKGKMAQSDFIVGFPHDKHIEIVSGIRKRSGAFVYASFVRENLRFAGEESCSVCHQTMAPQDKSVDEYFTKPPPTLGDAFWLKKGTFKTAPIGHTACFTCHSTDTGILPVPQTCSACHQLKPQQSAADFDGKLAATMVTGNKVMLDAWRRRDSAGTFRHEFFAHVELSCSTCHNVSTINTADPLTTKVSISTCATCHATPTADDGGAINYEIDMRKATAGFQCVKCHITFGKMPIPDSHTKAIADAQMVK